MKNKILLSVVVLLSIVLIVVLKNEDKQASLKDYSKITIKDSNEDIKKLNLDDYLVGVLAAEMPALFEIEALKAQAVAARSYAIYKINHATNDYDILTTVTDQSYISLEEMKNKWQDHYDEYYAKILNAVTATEDEVMLYNNEVIEAFYFSMSNGKTESASMVFQEDLPYLESVDSTWEENLNNFCTTITITKKEFCEKLNLNLNVPLKIEILEKSPSNRIVKIKINDQEFLGTDIRTKLNLRSTDFTIQENNENILITTKGYGHGVGMSQYGANIMAKNGSNYQDILNYYYQNITIKKMV